ncbi:hypothetical protein SG1472 [Sodalis glossinidius str. 'morsitans']|uniref:Uncharacterized protein n=1 Tax=Sodalis glossinidius (strain morsitans) TaxID=343509 RepID=Q2NSX8_SODGM|nr:autotransporter outer membrane beta-barrel domain-containing protein [Sodalis glossinidius]BAE74747.1 hypothetical protein SG1472 [Sodalis glossinidius str. 'morsitans']
MTTSPGTRIKTGSLMAPPFAPQTAIIPEVGIYAANHAVANTLFLSRRAERNGTTRMAFGTLAMDADPRSTLWLRILGGKTHVFVGDGRLQTSTTRQIVQGGGTILQFSRSGRDSGYLGIMFGAGKSTTESRSTSQPFGVQTGRARYVQDGRRQLTEFKVGHEGQLTPQIGVWGHVAHQRGAGSGAATRTDVARRQRTVFACGKPTCPGTA